MNHTSSLQDDDVRKKNETGPFYSDFTNKLAATLNELRKENQFCDIVITVGGRQFPAHKDVLAASSRYFQGMFMHGFKESSEMEIKINGDPDIFEVLLDYAYTGQMKIVPKIAYDILEMGCYMQFMDICPYCSQFMDLSKNSAKSSEDIQMADVFKMYQLTQGQSDLADVVERSMKYVSENIAEVKNSSYFLQTAKVSFFDDFLSRKDLSSEQEEAEVLEMVINWLKHDWTNRHQHTLRLLQQVRLGHVPEARLMELLDDKILETPGCQQLLEKVLGLIQKLQATEVSKSNLTLDYPDLFA